jgi:Tol biopolymer transport system component
VDGKRVAYVVESGGAPRPVPGIPAGGVIFGFFLKTGDILVLSGNRLTRQDTAGGGPITVLDTTSQGELWEAALSPSDRSVAFTILRPDGLVALYVAAAGDKPAAIETWTKISEGRFFIGSPTWSQDSRTLYYGSSRDDFFCVWAQRFAADGRPSGEPFAAFHNHKSPDMKMYGTCIVTAAPDRLYLMLSEFRGDLWSLKLSR